MKIIFVVNTVPDDAPAPYSAGASAGTVMTQLTYCGLVTPYGGIDLGQHWLR